MLALRLIRGSHPLVVLRRLAVASAACGVGFLLLVALGYALDHPRDPTPALTGLLWTLIPLAATAQLAVAVARSEAGPGRRSGLRAAGLGRGGLPLLATAATALSCLAGSTIALLLFLTLRGAPWTTPGSAADAQTPAGGGPLPVPATLTLLLLLPAVAAASCALTFHGRRTSAPSAADQPNAVPPANATKVPKQPARTGTSDLPATARVPAALPWSVALVATGLVVATGATDQGGDLAGAPLDPFDGIGVGVVAGWALIAVGIVLAAPTVVALTGRLVAAGRPGALRLLSGRLLQEEAPRLGGPFGVLVVVACGALSALSVYGTAPFGPFSVLGGGIVLACACGSLLTTAWSRPTAGDGVRATLPRLGAPPSLLRRLIALRVCALAVVLLTLVLALSWLVVLPLRP